MFRHTALAVTYRSILRNNILSRVRVNSQREKTVLTRRAAVIRDKQLRQMLVGRELVRYTDSFLMARREHVGESGEVVS